MSRLFISYKRGPHYGEWVQGPLYEMLRAHLLFNAALGKDDIFFDQHEDRGGSVRDRLEGGLRSAQVMLAVLTPFYFTSKWCQMEWTTFRARERRLGLCGAKGPKLVYPLVLCPDNDLLRYPDDVKGAFVDDSLEDHTTVTLKLRDSMSWKRCNDAIKPLAQKLIASLAAAPPPDPDLLIEDGVALPRPSSPKP